MDGSMASASERLRAGGLVAFATETVYGLGADATNGRAVATIFAVKRRPSFNPLIMHVPSAEIAALHGVMSPLARRLADAFWPGPLTIVMQRRSNSAVDDLATAGLATIALRVPGHPMALELLRAVDRPVAAPSANRSGRVSPTTAAHVRQEFEGMDVMVLEGGATVVGLESTVIDATGPVPLLLRPGGVTREAVEAVLGIAVERPSLDPDEIGAPRPNSPGQLASHYAPRARLRLEATEALDGEALLAFGPLAPAHTGPSYNLSPSGDLIEAATRLFAGLRWLDASGVATIAVMPIPTHDLGEAITDRLQRAAAPRRVPSSPV